MIRNYKFYDKEAIEPRIISYEFDPPFYENMDAELKEIYGSNLTFVKEINHRDKIIRIHSTYDSGKGTLYIPPAPRKKRRINFKTKVSIILSEKKSTILELKNEYFENLIFLFRKDRIEIFGDATFLNNSVSGYRLRFIDNNEESVFKFLKSKEFYPYHYEYLQPE
ncbi:hypothetical protein HN014_22135 (plasmid) [Aquimarina sp. TRL1]|uniref:hypothetical protein n=1 Tax=Aquimarina sp. (strain TRL1) TaxID=2736252 RepID=UPI00158F0F09|nr:hypothetical protein [Aquimarina sp. TRL1]QKX07701.1 hypothetical protein HN014_22135 [Aquimarina sp. TRL1]